MSRGKKRKLSEKRKGVTVKNVEAAKGVRKGEDAKYGSRQLRMRTTFPALLIKPQEWLSFVCFHSHSHNKKKAEETLPAVVC